MNLDLSPDKLSFVHDKNPLHRVASGLKTKLIQAQHNLVTNEFSDAGQLLHRVFDDLKLNLLAPPFLKDHPVGEIADVEFGVLRTLSADLLRKSGVAEDAISLQALAIAQRIHLVRAFHDPDKAIAKVFTKIADIVKTFPRTAQDIEKGRNPGDVLDPYILAATQILLHGGNYPSAVTTTVGHKALMIIEGLLGHLHEDIIGEMRGNTRVPEPRGTHQEMLDLETNPFPGADIVQPPDRADGTLRFHQVKSKTGSAKSGEGIRLGSQLKRLQDYYGGEIFYDALIGTTLRGHRSRGGVERAAPSVIVLVGEAAFRELTRSDIGPQLLLRVYQTAFNQVASASGYRVETMTESIVESFAKRAVEHGDTIIETILEAATKADPAEQDSRLEKRPKRPRRL